MPIQQADCKDAGKRTAQSTRGIKRNNDGTLLTGTNSRSHRAPPSKVDEVFVDLPQCIACLGRIKGKCRFKGVSSCSLHKLAFEIC